MSLQQWSLDMATKLTDYIKVYDGAVPRDKCTKIMRAFDKDFEHQEYIDQEKRPSFTQLNVTQRYRDKDTDWDPIQFELQQVFVDYASLYIQQLGVAVDFPDKYAFEEYRIKKYNANIDEFKDHVDVGDYNSARRFLVMFLYLNDVPQNGGGTTDFPRLDLQVRPVAGRMLIFPPTWQYRHAGRPILSGSKYILGTYLHYL